MERMKLGEIVEDTISGEWGTEEKKDENDIFVIRTADFCNDGRINYSNIIKRNIAKRKIEEKSLKIGDIIVEKSGGTDKNPVGRVVLFDKENCKCLANNFTQVLRIKKEHYYKFIFYQLFYKYKSGGTLQMFNKTTGIQNLQMKLYLNQKLNVCDKKEQIKISNLLDKVQEIVDIRKKEIEKLDELIKSQFVELFGNISEYERLENYAVLITKGASPKWQGINYQNDGTLFVTSENVREGFVDISKPKYLDNKINEILPRSILKRDDILINIVGASIGRAAKYDYDYLANINQAVALVRTQNINNIFLLTYLNSDGAIKMYDDMKKGGAMENLSLKNIADLRIPKASIELQNQFANIVKQIDKQKLEIQKSLEEMEKLQESLMNKYFG